MSNSCILGLGNEKELNLKLSNLVRRLARRLQTSLGSLLTLHARRVNCPLVEAVDIRGERPSVRLALKILKANVRSGKRSVTGHQSVKQIPGGSWRGLLCLLSLELLLLCHLLPHLLLHHLSLFG